MNQIRAAAGAGFTPTQGQYLAFIHAYTQLNGSRRPRPTCSASSR
jgi:hypothetical protein